MIVDLQTEGAGAAALAALIWNGRLGAVLRRPLRVVGGLLLLLVVGLSWYLMLGLTHEDGFDFMIDLFLKHHVGRFSEPMQGHGGPIFYYVIVVLLGFLLVVPAEWDGYSVAARREGRTGPDAA